MASPLHRQKYSPSNGEELNNSHQDREGMPVYRQVYRAEKPIAMEQAILRTGNGIVAESRQPASTITNACSCSPEVVSNVASPGCVCVSCSYRRRSRAAGCVQPQMNARQARQPVRVCGNAVRPQEGRRMRGTAAGTRWCRRCVASR